MEINNKGLYIFKDNDYKPYEIPQGKVIVCGVPGAFTSGCTNKHLPGYANNLEKLGCKVVLRYFYKMENLLKNLKIRLWKAH